MASLVLNKSISTDTKQQEYENLEPDYKRLLENMAYEIVTVDNLVKLSGLTAEVVSSMLLILELQGMIESQQGGQYYRCS